MKKSAAVTKMKATSGGSTTCTRKNSHWVAHPTVEFMALLAQTSTDDENGSIDANSENASAIGIRMMASIGKMKAAPAPVSSNQYGASASHPPRTAPGCDRDQAEQ